MDNVLTVSELTKSIKITLENSFSDVAIQGEISNFKSHYSGHWYFTLKDEFAQISCVMWRGKNSYVFFTPQDGMKVLLKGNITVYETRGNYQIDVYYMKPLGVGELQLAFEKLKEKLQKEGLFDEERKKPLPELPTRIGVITSKDGAAFRDVISVLKRRFPIAEVVLVHAQVQGVGASAEIANAIELMNRYKEVEVIILCRGGGSLEDLWAFNEEITARAIFKSKIPIVSAVGHETDYTIADFVADVRAATPSAAAELVTPHIDEIMNYINDFSFKSWDLIISLVREKYELIDSIIRSYSFSQPNSLINNRKQRLDFTLYKINNKIDLIWLKAKHNIDRMIKTINSSNPRLALAKGYTIVSQDDKIIQRLKDFDVAKSAEIEFFDGKIKIND